MSAGSHGVNFVEVLVGQRHEGLVSAAFIAVVLIVVSILARSRLEQHPIPLIPDSKLTLRNFFELVAQFLVNLSDNVMGHENRKYLPFVGTVFVYLLAMNLFGLIPGLSSPTDSISLNLGVALTVFILYNFWGVREMGIISYLKHFWGPIWWIGPLLFVVEIISHLVRPLSLSLRLYGNMTGDHMVLSIFTDLTKFAIPVIFYGLGTFVCFMQAFVFTLLTMVYIRFAVAHEESHH